MYCEFLGAECTHEYTDCPLETQPVDCPIMPAGEEEEEENESNPPGGPG